MFQTNVVEKIKKFLTSVALSENLAVKKIMWINAVELDRRQVTINTGHALRLLDK
jgi:hypothetical protein